MGQGPQIVLMGPGPSNLSATVQLIMTDPVISHMDPIFLELMDEVMKMLRRLFQTENEMTIPVSGTGSAGMEFCFVNLVEPGDAVVIGVNGLFGERMCDVAERCGATVHRVDAPWGKIVPAEALASAVEKVKPKIVALVHAETSTGALTPIEEVSRIAHDAGALLLVDVVTSLGGCPVYVDKWEIDAAYSATQKCLSCPPGLAPVTLSPKAMSVATNRSTKVQSWYLDVNLLANWWYQERVYHHTAPITMNYALHEALRVILKEGLTNRWKRHQDNHLRLKTGLKEIGFELASPEGHELWPLSPVKMPEGLNAGEIKKELLEKYNIEIGEGLGPLKDRILRVGLMGESSQPQNVDYFLKSFHEIVGKS